MSIDIPPELNWLVEIAAGQSWPQGDEDKLSELGDGWNTAAIQLHDVVYDVGEVSNNVLGGFNGPAADQFSSFMNSLYTSIPQMAQGAEQIGSMAKDTALQIEYSKYMILLQLLWMAEQIAEWTSTIFGAAAVPAIEAAGRFTVQAIIKTLIKQVARSVGESVAAMVGMDVAVQTIQFLKGDRTHWNTSSTIGALEMGALSGAVGGIVGVGAHVIAPDLMKTFVGHVVLGGVNGAVIGEVSNLAFGGDGNIGFAAAAGALGGAIGHGRGGGGGGGGPTDLNIHIDEDTPPPPYHEVADDRPPTYSPVPEPAPIDSGAHGGANGSANGSGSVNGGTRAGGSTGDGSGIALSSPPPEYSASPASAPAAASDHETGSGSSADDQTGSPLPATESADNPVATGSGSASASANGTAHSTDSGSSSSSSGSSSSSSSSSSGSGTAGSGSAGSVSSGGAARSTSDSGSGLTSSPPQGTNIRTTSQPSSTDVSGSSNHYTGLPGLESATPQPHAAESGPGVQAGAGEAHPVQTQSVQTAPVQAAPVQHPATPSPTSTPHETVTTTQPPATHAAGPGSPPPNTAHAGGPQPTQTHPTTTSSEPTPVPRPTTITAAPHTTESSPTPQTSQPSHSAAAGPSAPPSAPPVTSHQGPAQTAAPAPVAHEPSTGPAVGDQRPAGPSGLEGGPMPVATQVDAHAAPQPDAHAPAESPAPAVGSGGSAGSAAPHTPAQGPTRDSASGDTSAPPSTEVPPPSVRTQSDTGAIPGPAAHESDSPSTQHTDPTETSPTPVRTETETAPGSGPSEESRPAAGPGSRPEPESAAPTEPPAVTTHSDDPSAAPGDQRVTFGPGGSGDSHRAPGSSGDDFTDLVTRTLQNDSGRFGRAFVGPDDQARLEQHIGNFDASIGQVAHMTKNGDQWETTGHSQVPWDPTKPHYVAEVHTSDDGGFSVAVSSGKTSLSPGQFGGVLRRRPSFTGRPDEAPLVLVACQAAVRGPDGVAPAQHLADETGATVYAPTSDVIALDDGTGNFALTNDPDGHPGQWVKFEPQTTHTPAPEPVRPSSSPSTHGNSETHAPAPDSTSNPSDSHSGANDPVTFTRGSGSGGRGTGGSSSGSGAARATGGDHAPQTGGNTPRPAGQQSRPGQQSHTGQPQQAENTGGHGKIVKRAGGLVVDKPTNAVEAEFYRQIRALPEDDPLRQVVPRPYTEAEVAAIEARLGAGGGAANPTPGAEHPTPSAGPATERPAPIAEHPTPTTDPAAEHPVPTPTTEHTAPPPTEHPAPATEHPAPSTTPAAEHPTAAAEHPAPSTAPAAEHPAPADGGGSRVLIEDITHGMNDPHKLDVKIGARTASRTELERHLSAASAQIKKIKLKAVDKVTGSSSRGYRVVGGTGIKSSGQIDRAVAGRASDSHLQKYAAPEEGSVQDLAQKLQQQVLHIADVVRGSGKTFIASSVLMAVDHHPTGGSDDAVKAKLIDFAHAFGPGDEGMSQAQFDKYSNNFNDGIRNLAKTLGDIAQSRPARPEASTSATPADTHAAPADQTRTTHDTTGDTAAAAPAPAPATHQHTDAPSGQDTTTSGPPADRPAPTSGSGSGSGRDPFTFGDRNPTNPIRLETGGDQHTPADQSHSQAEGAPPLPSTGGGEHDAPHTDDAPRPVAPVASPAAHAPVSHENRPAQQPHTGQPQPAANTGGHGGIQRRVGGQVLEKPTNQVESDFYHMVRQLPADDPLRQVVPHSYTAAEVAHMEGRPAPGPAAPAPRAGAAPGADHPQPGGGGDPRVYIDNITHGMNDPHVLDVKIGAKTASKQELLRHLSASSAWLKKYKLKAADKVTGSSSRGYRVVGGTGITGGRSEIGRSSETHLRGYAAPDEGSVEQLAQQLHDQVQAIANAAAGSGRAFIGASVLMAVDRQPDSPAGAVRATLIDFAHTFSPDDEGMSQAQYDKYAGNFNDGIGNLTRDLGTIAHDQAGPSVAAPNPRTDRPAAAPGGGTAAVTDPGGDRGRPVAPGDTVAVSAPGDDRPVAPGGDSVAVADPGGDRPVAPGGGQHVTFGSGDQGGDSYRAPGSGGDHFTDLVTRTLQNDSGRFGRAFVGPEDQARLEQHIGNFDASIGQVAHMTKNGDQWETTGHSQVPWDPTKPHYVAEVHTSAKGDFSVAVSSGKTSLSPGQFGGVLRRRPSFTGRPDDAPLVLVACQAAVRGPDGVAPAQHLADETGATVYAPTSDVIALDDGTGNFALTNDPDGHPGQWVKFEPQTSPAPNTARPADFPNTLNSDAIHDPAHDNGTGPDIAPATGDDPFSFMNRGESSRTPASGSGTTRPPGGDHTSQPSGSRPGPTPGRSGFLPGPSAGPSAAVSHDTDPRDASDPRTGQPSGSQPHQPPQNRPFWRRQPQPGPARSTAGSLNQHIERLQQALDRNPPTAERVFGPDPLHVRVPPPPPHFLAVPRSRLGETMPPHQARSFFQQIDLARPDPRLPENSTIDVDGLEHADATGVTNGIPHIVHSAWFGGPLHDDGGSRADFMQNTAQSAHDHSPGNPAGNATFQHIVWTDVPREQFIAARGEIGPDDHELQQVKQFADWAHDNGVVLANVHEVFNAAVPMRTVDSAFRTEAARGNPNGWAGASDLGRVAIVHRFGGVYTDGDNVVHGNLRDLLDSPAVNDPRFAQQGLVTGWDDTRQSPVNNVLVGRPGAPYTDRYLSILSSRYRMTFSELVASHFELPLDDPAMRQRLHDEGGTNNDGRDVGSTYYETIYRTGPNSRLYEELSGSERDNPDQVAENLLLFHNETGPGGSVIRIEYGNSWRQQASGAQIEHPQETEGGASGNTASRNTASQDAAGGSSSATHPAPASAPPARPATPAQIQRGADGALVSLHREMASREGWVYLPAAARTISRLPEASQDAAWDSALTRFRNGMGNQAPAGGGAVRISARGLTLSPNTVDRIRELFPNTEIEGLPAHAPSVDGDSHNSATDAPAPVTHQHTDTPVDQETTTTAPTDHPAPDSGSAPAHASGSGSGSSREPFTFSDRSTGNPIRLETGDPHTPPDEPHGLTEGAPPAVTEHAPQTDQTTVRPAGDENRPAPAPQAQPQQHPHAGPAQQQPANTGGHGGIQRRVGGQVLEKPTNQVESDFYHTVRQLPADDPLRQVVPRSFTEAEVAHMEGRPAPQPAQAHAPGATHPQPGGGGDPRVYIENITHGMNDPHVLDVKIGAKTASKQELLRHLSASSAWLKKYKLKAADKVTGSSSRGYRVVGGTGITGGRSEIGRSSETHLRGYAAPDEGSVEQLAQQLHDQVQAIANAAAGSGRAFIGASVLMAVDRQPDSPAGAVRATLIDFAHTFSPDDPNMDQAQFDKYSRNFNDGIGNLTRDLGTIAHDQAERPGPSTAAGGTHTDTTRAPGASPRSPDSRPDLDRPAEPAGPEPRSGADTGTGAETGPRPATESRPPEPSPIPVPRPTTIDTTGPRWNEARPATGVLRSHRWVDPVSKVLDSHGNVVTRQGPRGPEPERFDLRGSFDVRRFEVDGQPVTDVTVRVRPDGESLDDAGLNAMWDRVVSGVEQRFNAPGYRRGNGDLLHVTVERAGPGESAHLTVGRAGSSDEMNQHAWSDDATPEAFAHEIGHQVGMFRDEYRAPGAEHRMDAPGSLAGDYRSNLTESDVPREWRNELSNGLMANQGVRARHLQLLDHIIGDVPLAHAQDHDGATHDEPPHDATAHDSTAHDSTAHDATPHDSTTHNGTGQQHHSPDSRNGAESKPRHAVPATAPGASPRAPSIPTAQLTRVVRPGDQSYPQVIHTQAEVDAANHSQFFVSQGVQHNSWISDPQSRTPNLVYRQEAPLRFSRDMSMAVEDTDLQAKVFFATTDHIARAQRQLGGRVVLRPTGGHLLVPGPDGRETRLERVEPVVQSRQGQVSGVDVRTPQRCNEMAEFVTGLHGLSGSQLWEQSLAGVLDRVRPTPPGRPSRASELQRRFNRASSGTQQDVNRYLRYGQEMAQEYQDLDAQRPHDLNAGLHRQHMNFFLRPQVGDAVATAAYGTPAQEAERQAHPERYLDYHFGGVVATDDHTFIAMENYARFDPLLQNSTASRGDPLFYFKMHSDDHPWHSNVKNAVFLGAVLSFSVPGPNHVHGGSSSHAAGSSSHAVASSSRRG